MHDHKDALERLLDEAIGTYASAQPRPGFERRILGRIVAGPARRSLMPWAIVIPAAAFILAAVVIELRPTTPEPPAPTPAPIAATVPNLAASRAANVPKERAKSHAPGESKPSALSAEERALLDLVRLAPDALASSERGVSLEPIEISQIEIKPLELRELELTEETNN
ncbi:MAG: hypothetical protein ACK5AZ_26600 [Bryobacteraceae bacterium]